MNGDLRLPDAPVEFIFGVFASVAILLLEQADDLFGIAARLVQMSGFETLMLALAD